MSQRFLNWSFLVVVMFAALSSDGYAQSGHTTMLPTIGDTPTAASHRSTVTPAAHITITSDVEKSRIDEGNGNKMMKPDSQVGSHSTENRAPGVGGDSRSTINDASIDGARNNNLSGIPGGGGM